MNILPHIQQHLHEIAIRSHPYPTPLINISYRRGNYTLLQVLPAGFSQPLPRPRAFSFPGGFSFKRKGSLNPRHRIESPISYRLGAFHAPFNDRVFQHFPSCMPLGFSLSFSKAFLPFFSQGFSFAKEKASRLREQSLTVNWEASFNRFISLWD